MTSKIEVAKFNEITNAIADATEKAISGLPLRERMTFNNSTLRASILASYPADVAAAYVAECERLAADDAASSDTTGTY